jgi:hypothetical protein
MGRMPSWRRLKCSSRCFGCWRLAFNQERLGAIGAEVDHAKALSRDPTSLGAEAALDQANRLEGFDVLPASIDIDLDAAGRDKTERFAPRFMEPSSSGHLVLDDRKLFELVRTRQPLRMSLVSLRGAGQPSFGEGALDVRLLDQLVGLNPVVVAFPARVRVCAAPRIGMTEPLQNARHDIALGIGPKCPMPGRTRRR